MLEKVSKANYGVKYTARAYVLVEYADGTQAYVYSEFDEANHVRSMYDVASAAIVDNAAGYTDTQKTIIQKYIDGVIDLNGYLELQGRERNYTVSVSDIDANGDYLSPGFIDIHVHGGGNKSAMSESPEDIIAMAEAHLKYGTTSIVPTTLAAPIEQLKKVEADD